MECDTGKAAEMGDTFGENGTSAVSQRKAQFQRANRISQLPPFSSEAPAGAWAPIAGFTSVAEARSCTSVSGFSKVGILDDDVGRFSADLLDDALTLGAES